MVSQTMVLPTKAETVAESEEKMVLEEHLGEDRYLPVHQNHIILERLNRGQQVVQIPILVEVVDILAVTRIIKDSQELGVPGTLVE